VRHARITLSVLLKSAHAEGLVGPIVTEGAEMTGRATKPARETTFPTAEKVARVLAAVRGERWEGVLALMALTGMRRGEVLGLSWSALDLNAGALVVRRSLVRIGTDLVLGEPKSRKSHRVVMVAPEVVAVLRRWRAEQSAEHLVAGPGWGDGHWSDEGSPARSALAVANVLTDSFEAGLAVLLLDPGTDPNEPDRERPKGDGEGDVGQQEHGGERTAEPRPIASSGLMTCGQTASAWKANRGHRLRRGRRAGDRAGGRGRAVSGRHQRQAQTSRRPAPLVTGGDAVRGADAGASGERRPDADHRDVSSRSRPRRSARPRCDVG
jgi:hypothetical protein